MKLSNKGCVLNMSERIIDVNSLEQYKKDMQRYGLCLTRERVLPNYLDGLKEVQRKILYAMYNDEKAMGSNFVKSQAVIGTVMKAYHPHSGDGIYTSIKTMSNWFEINKPLISQQGAFGTIQGEGASAPRYTEISLSPFALDCVIGDLKESRQSTDWIKTYDDKTIEPEYLPCAVPLLLINGSFGIAFGIKVEIPRHNINDVIDATIDVLHDPVNAEVVLIPDHCTPCEIIDEGGFKGISNRGFGYYIVRGAIDIGEIDYRGSKHPCLTIRSIPDITFLNSITERLEKLIESNKIVQILDTHDNTDLKHLEFVIILKKGSDPGFVRDMIYKNTEMEKRMRVNFEVLNGINPMRMSYKSYLQGFIEFRKMTKFRLYCNRLQDVQTRIHQLETYISIISSTDCDAVIQMIRSQKTIDDNALIETLIKKLKITDLQAKFIISADLKKLSKGYLSKYAAEKAELKEREKVYYNKIVNEDEIIRDIEDELLQFKKKYGNPHRCKIISKEDISSVPKGEFKIVVYSNNFIKKVGVNDTIGYAKDVCSVIKGDNTENIIVFDIFGRVFKLPISKIPFTEKRSPGIDIRLMSKYITAPIGCAIYEPFLKEYSRKVHKFFLVVVTKSGNIKKMDLDDFITIPPSGLQYTKLDEGDMVIDVMVIPDGMDVILYSDSKALRMNISDITHLKRSAKGSMGMKTSIGVDGMSVITADTTDIIVVTTNGFINRFIAGALPSLGKGKSGSKVIQLGKNDSIKAIYGVNTRDSIQIITANDKRVIPVSSIPDGSSVSKGTKMVSTKSDTIIKCSVIRGDVSM